MKSPLVVKQDAVVPVVRLFLVDCHKSGKLMEKVVFSSNARLTCMRWWLPVSSVGQNYHAVVGVYSILGASVCTDTSKCLGTIMLLILSVVLVLS